jgi:hypothetical protein|tara:strand:+ start:869 stop:1081 length:213 start_codon:yes stop_codon:yes gene_type:complete
MTYKDDERFNAWMKDIIESSWQAVETYEAYLLGLKNSKVLSKKMRELYDKLPIDPDRKKAGKDVQKEDPK